MVCVFKHLYCSAQLSMSNMEKRYRNKINQISLYLSSSSLSEPSSSSSSCKVPLISIWLCSAGAFLHMTVKISHSNIYILMKSLSVCLFAHPESFLEFVSMQGCFTFFLSFFFVFVCLFVCLFVVCLFGWVFFLLSLSCNTYTLYLF